ncbi:MAG TPA: hypothetical protein VEY10_18300 [Flavisolibacter sp.]|jgi:hypothetical protein|nr:hypothetical protein [Flavisolibacter sp.]
MANKENRGGILSNEQIEQDLEAKGKTDAPNGYIGGQDTGDNGLREMGTAVQRRDGQPEDEDEMGKGN